MLDDSDDADVLTHFLPSIRFIQAELDKGRGVLVHCLAVVRRRFFETMESQAAFRSQYDHHGGVSDAR